MKKKLGFMLMVCALCASAAFAFSACQEGPAGPKGEPGKDGATWLVGVVDPATDAGVDGDMYLNTETFDLYVKADGAWVLQGNIKGGSEEEKDLVCLIFADEYGSMVSDPMMVPKGEVIEFPQLTARAKELIGWRHGLKVIDPTAPIQESMVLTPHWKPILEMKADSNNDYYVGEELLFNGVYGGYGRGFEITNINHNGVDYTEEEAMEADVLLTHDYDRWTDSLLGESMLEEEYTSIESTLILGKMGDYVVTYAIKGMEIDSEVTQQVSFTLGSPEAVDEMALYSIKFTDGRDLGMYRDGDEVTLYDTLNRPAPKLTYWFTSSYLTKFTATVNGEPVTPSVSNSVGSEHWIVTLDCGEFDEAVTTYEFKVVATSEYSGTITTTFTVHLAQHPETSMIMNNSYNKYIVLDSNEDTFTQSVQLYDAIGGDTTVTNTLKNAAGEEIDASFITTTLDGWGSINSFKNTFEVDGGEATLAVGDYTLTSHITGSTSSGTIDLTTEANFSVLPNWTCENLGNTCYTDLPIELTYELAAEAKSLVLANRVPLNVGEEKTFEYTGYNVTASFTVAEGKTFLKIVAVVPYEMSYYTNGWFACTVETATHTYFTCLSRPRVEDGESLKMRIAMDLMADLYALEEYFADEIVLEGNPLKALYDLINVDIANMTLVELLAFVETEELADARTAIEEYLIDKAIPEGKEFTDYVKAAQEKVLAEHPFDDEVILKVDIMMIGLFDEDRWVEWGEYTYYDVFMLASYVEALYMMEDGKVLSDMIYEDMEIEEMLEEGYMSSEEIAILQEIVDTKAAAEKALADGAENADELVYEYCTAMNNFLLIYIQYVGIL